MSLAGTGQRRNRFNSMAAGRAIGHLCGVAPLAYSGVVYDVALTVQSCLRAGTAVHVAWIVAGHPADPTEAVAITPGGGRVGSLLGGGFDGALADAVHGVGETGGLVRLPVGPVEALLTSLSEGTQLTMALAPASVFPGELWDRLAARVPAAFALDVADGRFTGARLADPSGGSTVEMSDDVLTVSLSPVPRVVVSGGGPIADAIADVFARAEWRADVIGDVTAAVGVLATLAAHDAVVVMGHDVEVAGRALQAAIESRVGYIGSIGSPRMQQLRRDWLAYRGVDWDARVHGPAGLPIGASNPGEIAVSIVAEAIGSLRSFQEPGGS